MAKGLNILNTLILLTYTGHIIANYCFQGLIGLDKLLYLYPFTNFIF